MFSSIRPGESNSFKGAISIDSSFELRKYIWFRNIMIKKHKARYSQNNQRQGDKLINMFDFESEKTKTNRNWGLFETIIG